MNTVLRIVIASGGTRALPVRTDWPVHKALAWVGAESVRQGSALANVISTFPDPDVGRAVCGTSQSLANLVDQGFLVLEGQGYTARWRVDQAAATAARRELMREDLATARILVHAGQRLATWASTALRTQIQPPHRGRRSSQGRRLPFASRQSWRFYSRLSTGADLAAGLQRGLSR
jgi:hypothetical protein